MVYFEGYDIDGISCRVEEMGNDVGLVSSYQGCFQAVRVAPSTYIATNGKVYGSTQQKCIDYSTPRYFNYAKNKMRDLGWR